MPEQEFYTDEELELIRQKMREGNARAREIRERKGHTVNPRIKAAKDAERLKGS